MDIVAMKIAAAIIKLCEAVGASAYSIAHYVAMNMKGVGYTVMGIVIFIMLIIIGLFLKGNPYEK